MFKKACKNWEDEDSLKILKNWLSINETVSKIKKRLKELSTTADLSIMEKLNEGSTLEYISEIDIINQYIALRDQEAELKKEIKDKVQELDDKLYAKYPELSESEVKQLVVDDKWMQTIEVSIKGEIDHISQHLTNRIKELAERYETPLPVIDKEVSDLENRVNAHLEKMGFVWN